MKTDSATKNIRRVLMIAPTPFFADRGGHMHISEQAYALQRQGVQVKIVTYNLGRDLPDLDIVRTVKFPWYKKLGPGPSWHKFYIDIFLLVTAIKAARSFKPDVIHAHLHEGCVLGAVVSRIFSIPLLFDVQGSLTGELIAHNFPLVKGKYLRNFWYGIERWIDHLPNMLIAQSTEMKAELLGHFQVDPEKIAMAYDGVNTHIFRPGERDQELLRKLGIPEGKKIIVYLGGLSPHKGVDILLDAFPHVLKNVPQAYLLLMGYPNENHYRRRVKDMQLEDYVAVTGQIKYEEAPRYLTLGDIAVAPKRSQTEANGKIYNYMAAGLPTVAFDTVVNRDILGDLGTFVHDLDDVDGLAEAIVRLLTDDPARIALATKVRQKAVTDYSWDNVGKRILLAYQKASVGVDNNKPSFQ